MNKPFVLRRGEPMFVETPACLVPMRRPRRARGAGSGGGRPRLDRARHTFNPTFETVVYDRLATQARSVGLSTATYVELLVAEAHGYFGQYLATLDSLPAPVSATTLRELRASRTGGDYDDGLDRDSRRMSFCVDQELADRIDAITEELGISYATYLRQILYDATGFERRSDSAMQLKATFDQGVLIRSA